MGRTRLDTQITDIVEQGGTLRLLMIEQGGTLFLLIEQGGTLFLLIEQGGGTQVSDRTRRDIGYCGAELVTGSGSSSDFLAVCTGF